MTFPTASAAERSFYYRIPAFAALEVRNLVGANSTRISERVEWPLPKLGKFCFVPRMRSTGTARAEVTLDAETGRAAWRLLQDDHFGAAATSTGKNVAGILEARAKADVDEELAALQRPKALLAAELAIKVAKEALGKE